ncbi:MAG: ceramidase domain-containing protein [Gammaproteobacteria bacterium]|jgi:hypothetical protein
MMNQYLDQYCERIAPGLWGEPLNLLSNAAFLIAGFLAWRMLTTDRFQWHRSPADITLLVALLFAIGIGSGLWHLTAHYWALWSDRIPILLFINLYLLSCLFRVVDLSVIGGIGVFAGYHVINAGTLLMLPADFMNGSVFYLPTWFFLAGITVVIWHRQYNVKQYFSWALIVLTVSLAFRTMDNAICGALQTGTHFLWHLLNAITLYILMLGLIDKYRMPESS